MKITIASLLLITAMRTLAQDQASGDAYLFNSSYNTNVTGSIADAYTGNIGLNFQVMAADVPSGDTVYITALGFYAVSGAVGANHTLSLWGPSVTSKGNLDGDNLTNVTLLAGANVDTNAFAWVALNPPIALVAGDYYDLLASVTSGGPDAYLQPFEGGGTSGPAVIYVSTNSPFAPVIGAYSTSGYAYSGSAYLGPNIQYEIEGPTHVGPSEETIALDPKQPGRTFEGIGAVSAGASSRLLIDYPEPERSQVLDYLFKPDYGASLQHLKVEIGGGVNSTDGTEPTFEPVRGTMNFSSGYEWWLMQQARARNSNIILDCLAWGAPGWIGNGNYYSSDMCNYIVNFINGAESTYGLNFNFTGTHNEAAVNTTETAWIKTLRSALNAGGLQTVQLVAADEWGGTWNIVTNTSCGLLYDTVLSNDIARVSAHYPGQTSPAAAQTCGKLLWSSEDGIGGSTWTTATNLARIFNRNYINGKITTTEIWSPVTSYYDILAAPDSGLMRANTPWSGNFDVAPAIWATAHTTQFAAPGWNYLEGGASALLPGGGSAVTLVSTNQSDYSIVVETSDALAAQTITFRLTNGLSTAPVNVWETTQTNQFVNVGQFMPVNGTFSYTFQPGAIYSLTTTAGQSKGDATPPPAGPFPLPYKDNFESYAPGATPKYFSDQAGTFEVVTRADGQGQSLRQISPQTGIRWTSEWQPYSLIGDATWADYDVSADVLVEANGGLAFVTGRVGSVPGFTNPLPQGYWLALNNATSQWQLYASTNLLASGTANFATNTWHNLRLAMQGTSLRCYVDYVLVTNLTDYTYSSGMSGLGCGGWYGAQFDNFTLRQLHSDDFDLALSATASASSVWDDDYADYGPALANDGNPDTRWNTAYPTLAQEWLELDWPTPITFNRTAYSQFESRISGYQIQHWNGSSWIVDVNGGTMGAYATDIFPTVTASKVRLVLTNMTSAPSIYEFYVYNDAPPPASAPSICINEWMTDNTRTVADPANSQFEPWFELYNAGATIVNLDGYYLTSSPTNLFQFQIPSGYSLAPGGFLLVWADGLTSQNSGSDLHVNFSLQPSAEIGLLNSTSPAAPPAAGNYSTQSSMIALVNSAGQIADAVDLLPQSADVSSGSNPDDDPGILNLVVPTPRRSNDQIWAFPPAYSARTGAVALNFNGFPYASNQILTANAPLGPWTILATIFSDGLGAFSFTDTNTASRTSRFYRGAAAP
ncbi:MAG TPA: lamin tail domain-containing protein [Alphaproteobacteria bacterium]|nr:lamin tail domain-containing protein [Alphaproteobacteria bacterium]